MVNYVGKRLDGRYEILEVIGLGGMAVVYKAFDSIEKRTVAVKILKEEYLTDEAFKRRFKNESKAIAVLSHPNIVKVLDVSLGDRLQYIVMEYVEGITLKEYIQQQGKVRIKEAIYFIVQILRALQHAHDKGIIHRDIKPQNIMLIDNGTIKVTDFGIATFTREETKTMTEAVMGSVHYISPEQAKGTVTDAKSDIYSVGVVLYEMLTGSLPFQSENAVSVALMQIQKDPKTPRELNPNIPIGLEQIVLKAMQKNPFNRYQSAAEMLVDISEFGKNPSIKFDYTFFNDKQPTKYIPSEDVKEALKKDENKPSEDNNQDSDSSDKDNKKKKKIAVLAGVLSGLIIFVIVMIAILVSGSSKKLTVPKFVGLNYTSDIASGDEFADFKDMIETKFVVDSSVDDGVVLSQDPEAGKKISPGKTITLEIASNASKVTIPEVDGLDLATALSSLRSEGFLTSVEYEENDDVEEGKVIRTSPAGGEKATFGSTITIYIPGKVPDMVTVPTLSGKTYYEALDALEEVGLEVDESGTSYRDSERPYNEVIGNALAGQEVEVGTKIALYISTGVAYHVNVTVPLPDVDSKSGHMTATINGFKVNDADRDVTLNGGSVSIKVGGNTNAKLIVYVDGQQIYSANINFASGSQSEDAYVSDAKTSKYTTEKETDKETEKDTTKEKTTKEKTDDESTTKEPSTTKSTTEPSTTQPTTTTERQTEDHEPSIESGD